MPHTTSSPIPESELMVNADGSIFHLHLCPRQLADKVILVGDPGRVSLVVSHFDIIEHQVENREFRSVTGLYRDKRLTVVSTGIGCDNIDIVMNELDALANIDLNTRRIKETRRTLELVRIGTCGGLQPDTPTGSYIVSERSIGFDGLLNFYAGRDLVCDLTFEAAFKEQTGWDAALGNPYAIRADEELTARISGKGDNRFIRGTTITCGGFYGPQGRLLRLPLADPKLNEKIQAFEHQGQRITNFEMESSALAGLSALLGHKATTVCMVVANRFAHKSDTGYRSSIDDLIQIVLDRF